MSRSEVCIAAPSSSGTDAALAINAAIAALASSYGGGTIELEPSVYSLQTPIERRRNVLIKGAFNGSFLFGGQPDFGTVLKWAGAVNGTCVTDTPVAGDTVPFFGGGITDLTIDGNGVAANGLVATSVSRARYERLNVKGVTQNALYFTTVAGQALVQTYRVRLDDIDVNVSGAANGIVLDGVTGSGSNTCFMSARNCHVTFENGVAYCLLYADDCTFVACGGSKVTGGTGAAIFFSGTSDGTEKAAYGNQFLGFNLNATIRAQGGWNPSRGNLVLATAVDAVPPISQDSNATMTLLITDGESGFNGFVRGWPANG